MPTAYRNFILAPYPREVPDTIRPVRELVVIIPDLFLRDVGSDGPAAVAMAPVTALTALRYAAPRLMRGGWRAMLARGVGRADLALVDVASVIDASLRIDAPVESAPDVVADTVTDTVPDVWLAAPLHLLAGLKTLHFPANGLLRLPPDEAAELSARFAEVFGADGLTLTPAGSAGFVLRGFAAPGTLTVDPARLIGDGLEASLPAGAGSAALRALSSEIEMWLHDLPLNRRRELRGEPRISSLWLWGGGQPPRDPLTAIASAADTDGAVRWARLLADDAWVQALARLAGVESQPLGVSADVAFDARLDELFDRNEGSACVIAPLAGLDLERYDRTCIAPVAAALAAGRLERCVVAANDRWIAVSRGDRLRFWRPRRTWLAAVTEGGA
jgi:hypothetical protein